MKDIISICALLFLFSNAGQHKKSSVLHCRLLPPTFWWGKLSDFPFPFPFLLSVSPFSLPFYSFFTVWHNSRTRPPLISSCLEPAMLSKQRKVCIVILNTMKHVRLLWLFHVVSLTRVCVSLSLGCWQGDVLVSYTRASWFVPGFTDEVWRLPERPDSTQEGSQR